MDESLTINNSNAGVNEAGAEKQSSSEEGGKTKKAAEKKTAGNKHNNQDDNLVDNLLKTFGGKVIK